MFGLILLGSRSRPSTLSTGEFYCPQCRANRRYAHRRLTRYFTAYFIPLFPIERQGEYIECQTCLNAFALSVLEPTGPVRIQALMHDLDAQLQVGHSVQLLVNRLLAAGAAQEEAAWAVYSAGHGKFAACENCQLLYESSLRYCGNCGHRLGPFQGRLG